MNKDRTERLINRIRSFESVKPGWIYAMQESPSGLTKIGRSSDVRFRLKQIRILNIHVVLVASAYVPCCLADVEHSIHANFSKNRIEGEWFNISITQSCLTELVTTAFKDALAIAETFTPDVAAKWLYPGTKRFNSPLYEHTLGEPYQ